MIDDEDWRGRRSGAPKDDGERMIVHLVHSKYFSKAEPGTRVSDLYAVCGQAHRARTTPAHRRDGQRPSAA